MLSDGESVTLQSVNVVETPFLHPYLLPLSESG